MEIMEKDLEKAPSLDISVVVPLYNEDEGNEG